MHTTTKKSITCFVCDSDIPLNCFKSINVTNNPELRTMIFNNTFFKQQCPTCGCFNNIVYPCLYHDMIKKFMIYFSPQSRIRTSNDNFIGLEDINKRIVFNIDDLKELILIFESELSDMAICLTKLALFESESKRQHQQPSSCHFCGLEPDTHTLKFILTSVNGNSRYCKISREIYEKSLSIVSTTNNLINYQNNFSVIDLEWATSTLLNYKSNV